MLKLKKSDLKKLESRSLSGLTDVLCAAELRGFKNGTAAIMHSTLATIDQAIQDGSSMTDLRKALADVKLDKIAEGYQKRALWGRPKS